MPFHVDLDKVDAPAADFVVQPHRRHSDLLNADAALSVETMGKA